MTTPEGKIKKKVRQVLNDHGVYYLQPVQMGYGAAGVDFHCCVRYRNFSLGFFIETKKEDKDFTERQQLFAEERAQHQRAITFKIRDEAGVARLERWLCKIQDKNREYDQSSMTTTSPPKTL